MNKIIKMGIASNHRKTAIKVIDEHNKRLAKKHKSNIDTSRTHLNWYGVEQKRGEKHTAKQTISSALAKYEEWVFSDKCKKSQIQKGELISNNKKRSKEVHSFVFQIGGEESLTDEGFNFNEYFIGVFPDEIKRDILIQFGREFTMWCQDEFPKISGRKSKSGILALDATVHMDETTPHLHLSYLCCDKKTYRLTEGVFNNMHFNKAMNTFAKEKLVELTRQYAEKRLLSNDFALNDVNRQKIEELSRIVAKNDKEDGLLPKYAPNFSTDEVLKVKKELKTKISNLKKEIEDLKEEEKLLDDSLEPLSKKVSNKKEELGKLDKELADTNLLISQRKANMENIKYNNQMLENTLPRNFLLELVKLNKVPELEYLENVDGSFVIYDNFNREDVDLSFEIVFEKLESSGKLDELIRGIALGRDR